MFWEYAIELRTLPVLGEEDKLAVKDTGLIRIHKLAAEDFVQYQRPAVSADTYHRVASAATAGCEAGAVTAKATSRGNARSIRASVVSASPSSPSLLFPAKSQLGVHSQRKREGPHA